MTPVTDAVFGESITLLGYQLDAGQISLLWQAAAPLPQNYTVFVQVLDDNNTLVAQGDAPPALPTRYWMAGERIVTTHAIGNADGLHIVLGWYSADGSRLPINAPDNAYRLK